MEVNDARTAHGYSARPRSERLAFAFPLNISFSSSCSDRRCHARDQLNLRKEMPPHIALRLFSLSTATQQHVFYFSCYLIATCTNQIDKDALKRICCVAKLYGGYRRNADAHGPAKRSFDDDTDTTKARMGPRTDARQKSADTFKSASQPASMLLGASRFAQFKIFDHLKGHLSMMKKYLLPLLLVSTSVFADNSSPHGAKAPGIFAPVELKNLDANWQFDHDADKVPIILKAMASVHLRPGKYFKNDAMCASFPTDFQAGRFEVIEPDYQALSYEDTLPDFKLPPAKVGKLPRDDLRTLWHQCDGMEVADSTAENPNDVFQMLGVGSDLPPFRFYHVVLDSNSKNPKLADIYLHRSGEYQHYYSQIDLGACIRKMTVGAGDLLHEQHTDNKYKTLSLLVRYRGQAAVLVYSNWPEAGQVQPEVKINLGSYATGKGCAWTGDPADALKKASNSK